MRHSVCCSCNFTFTVVNIGSYHNGQPCVQHSTREEGHLLPLQLGWQFFFERLYPLDTPPPPPPPPRSTRTLLCAYCCCTLPPPPPHYSWIFHLFQGVLGMPIAAYHTWKCVPSALQHGMSYIQSCEQWVRVCHGSQV